jgi:hypothetical protein
VNLDHQRVDPILVVETEPARDRRLEIDAKRVRLPVDLQMQRLARGHQDVHLAVQRRPFVAPLKPCEP